MACFKGQYADERNKIEYQRWIPIEEVRWSDFKSKAIDPHTGEYYTNGEGSGIPKGKEGPKRYVTSIIRLKTNDGVEYLLSKSKIIGYNQSGDEISTTADNPEKFTKTNFRWETQPNYDTGFAERRNAGPSGSEIVYTLPFTKEDAQKLFELRDNKQGIQLIVKSEAQDKVYEIKKPDGTLQENFQLFAESDFNYLFNANFLSKEQKEYNMRIAETVGLIPKQTDDERTASILAQEVSRKRINI